MLPSGGSAAMPEERLQRIEKIVTLLQNIKVDFFQRNASIIICDQLTENARMDWEHAFERCSVQVALPGRDCHLAIEVFDKKMAEHTELFATIRMAELEVDNKYLPDVHDDFFAHFDWRTFTPEEMSVCPPVLLFTKDNLLVENELNTFSQLLSSNRPIKMLVLKQGVQSADGFAYRQELGALAIGPPQRIRAAVRRCHSQQTDRGFPGRSGQFRPGTVPHLLTNW